MTTLGNTIDSFMTHGVHTIARNRTMEDAHRMMRELNVRHLPVLDGGKLVGLVTQRDLALVETLRSVDPKSVGVDDAMSEDVFAVSPDAPLATVARKMAEEKIGSAVVMRGAKVVGIFTAIDALRALDFLFTSPAFRDALNDAMVTPGVTPRKS